MAVASSPRQCPLAIAAQQQQPNNDGTAQQQQGRLRAAPSLSLRCSMGA